MAINDGGYTFIPNEMIAKLSVNDINSLFTRKTDVLLRISKPDGTQPYTVITKQKNTGGLSVQLSRYQGYARPVNYQLGPYLYLGTLPPRQSGNNKLLGFKSNGRNVLYRNCHNGKQNQFSFFSNPYERKPSDYHIRNLVYERRGVAVDWRRTAKRPYSGRRMPLDFFLFTEMHFGGCGTYTSSDRWLNSVQPAHGTAIGLR